MADDSHGMGIPLPADSTRITDFPKVARAGFEQIAKVLAGGVTEGQKSIIRAEVVPAVAKEIAAAGVFKGAGPSPDNSVALSFTDRDGRRFWMEAGFDGRPTRHAVEVLTEDLAGTMSAAVGPELGITPLPDHFNWAWVVTDAADRVLGGFRDDGVFMPSKMAYPADSVPLSALSANVRRELAAGSSRPVALPAGAGIISTREAGSGWQLRYDDAETGISTLLFTAGALQNVTLSADAKTVYFTASNADGTNPRALQVPAGGGTARRLLPYAGLASFGDSMTEGMGGGYGVNAFPAVTAAELGIPYYNGGISMQMSTEIAIRQGGIAPALTVSGGQIPAAGSVAVTVTDPINQFRAGSAWNWAGTVAGIAGTLTKSADTPAAWTFTRATAGSPKAAPAGTRFLSTPGAEHNDWIQTIWTGRNNPQAGTILRDTAAMVAYLSPAQKRYLVFSVCNTASEPAGSDGYRNIETINAQLSEAYGARFLDVRTYLVQNALAAAGISATAQDRADVAADIIPGSLRADSTHLNQAGYAVLGRYVASVIKTKGWI